MDRSVTPHLARTPAQPAARPQRPSFHRVARRALVAAAGFLVIALIIFFMLPVWISNEQGRTYVLSHISKRINGSLVIRNWKLGWFRGTEIEDLTITLADGKQLLHCPRIETDLTLWSLLWGNYDLGNTRITSPRLTATRYVDGTNDFTRLLRPDTAGPNPLQSIRGNIVCEHGSVELSAQNTATPIAITDVAAQIPIASHTAPIHFSASGTSTTAQLSKPVSITADLPAPVTWTENPTAMLANLSLSAESLPTATLAVWLGLDPRWQDSFGKILTKVAFESRPDDVPERSVVRFHVYGPGSLKTRMQLEVLMRMLTHAGDIQLSPASSSELPLNARLSLSAPMVALLTRVNPVFASLERTGDPLEIQAGDLTIDADHPATTTGTFYAMLPAMTFRQDALLKEILKDTGPASPASTLTANSALLKFTAADGRIAYTDLGLTLSNRQRLVFSGSVGFDESIDLILTLTQVRSFGSATLQIPIKGTLAKPHLENPAAPG